MQVRHENMPCTCQVRAETCAYLEVAKEYKGRSEPMFLLYRVRTILIQILSITILSIYNGSFAIRLSERAIKGQD